MADRLHDRLAALGTGTPPVLPPAAAVRARGEQRRARARALMAAAAGVTAVAVLGGIALVTRDASRPDSLRPAPYASAAPAPRPPSVGAAALLSAEALGTLRGGTWTVSQPDLLTTSPFVTPCPEPPAEAPAGRTRVLDGPGGQSVTNQVLSYPDGGAAAAALGAVAEELERCPSQREDWNNGLASLQFARLSGLPGDGPKRLYGTSTSRECVNCPRQVRHFSVSVTGRQLVLVRLSNAGAEDLPPLADAADQQARCAEDACSPRPASSPAATPRWTLEEAFLSPESAVAAEHPGWSMRTPYEPEPGPLADPCEENAVPVADQVLASAERAMGSEREAGGSSVAQELYRYSSAPAAQDAFRLYTDRYYRCARVPDPNGPDGMTLQSQVIDLEERPDGSRLVVRRVPCQEGQCTDHFSTYVFVVQHRDALTAVAYTIAEDGDPAKEAASLAVAVERHLRAVVGG